MNDELKEELQIEAEIIKNLANNFEKYTDNYNKLVLAANMIEQVAEGR